MFINFQLLLNIYWCSPRLHY